MNIKEILQQSLKESMKNKDGTRTNAIRNILSGFTEFEKQKAGNEITEETAITLLSNFAKKRRESIELYTKGNRPELAEAEQKELNVIMEYLPAQASDEEIRTAIEELISSNGIEQDKKNMGRVMGMVMPMFKGKADGNNVKKIVAEVLS